MQKWLVKSGHPCLCQIERSAAAFWHADWQQRGEDYLFVAANIVGFCALRKGLASPCALGGAGLNMRCDQLHRLEYPSSSEALIGPARALTHDCIWMSAAPSRQRLRSVPW